ncbi:Sir2 family NAD-dependent protein deacetylase [Candidatus Acetothermia bacterium]|nr:Sir2 family NAD-dependent protein deacetylase [Candidatus Acetothermia bacterium]
MRDEVKHKTRQIAELLRNSEYALALTGAGVSTESGIPDFRSPNNGLWAKYDPMEVASIQGFRNNPARFYEFWKLRFGVLTQAQPNVTHHFLTDMEQRGQLKGVITQNIDNLHRRAGSKTVYDVHGNYARGMCVDCEHEYPIETVFAKVETQRIPLCDHCHGLLKPDVVLFGELLPSSFEDAMHETSRCDFMFVLGTSLEVHPVADLVPQAKSVGAKVAIINRDPTPYDWIADIVIHSQLGPTVELLKQEVA